MSNIIFELDRLRIALESRGIPHTAIEKIVDKARSEIRDAFNYHGGAAMEAAIDAGVEKNSPEFINELRLDDLNLELTTDSGNMDFSVPPYPNLQNLLRNAKPIKDGSGVYKVIPVGKDSGERRKIASNIYDAQKQIMAQRAEDAKATRSKLTPKGSKSDQMFKTATSKQNAATQWVMPAQEKDFSSEVKSINADLSKTMDEIVNDIISSYMEAF